MAKPRTAAAIPEQSIAYPSEGGSYVVQPNGTVDKVAGTEPAPTTSAADQEAATSPVETKEQE